MKAVSTTSKLRLVEQAIWDGVAPSGENQVVIDDGWVQQTTPHAPTAFLNGVYRCELDEASARERIPNTVAHFKALNLPFRWKIGPSSTPTDLKERLIEHGLIHKDTLFGLIAMPDQLSIPVNPEVEVAELTTENLEDWLTVQASAWNVPPPGISHIRRTQTEALAKGDKTYLNYLAYHKGEPVASAALRFFPDYAFLMGAAVNPDKRGKGIYRSLLAHRLEIIGARGLPAVIHCLEKTSAPICLKLGFEKVCEIQSFENA